MFRSRSTQSPAADRGRSGELLQKQLYLFPFDSVVIHVKSGAIVICLSACMLMFLGLQSCWRGARKHHPGSEQRSWFAKTVEHPLGATKQDAEEPGIVGWLLSQTRTSAGLGSSCWSDPDR